MNADQKFTGEKALTVLVTFIMFACIALYFCWWQRFFPSMDGPSHFHNSILLKEYLSGNQVIHDNFVLTPFYNPNIFSTYFIAFLYLFLPFKGVAFVFFFLYFLLSFYSTRALLKSFNINLAALTSLAVVVFFNSTLLNLGFYNFSWSIVFLFFIIAFFRENIKPGKTTSKAWLIYLFLLLLVYYSNALTFIFYLLYLFAVEVVFFKSVLNNLKEEYKKRLPFLFKNMLLLLPFLVLLLCFYIKSPLSQVTTPNDIKTYHELLLDMSSLVVYGAAEKEFTHLFFYGFLAWFVLVIIIRAIKKEWIRRGDFFLLLALAMLVAYYMVPDNSGVGMMSVRFQHFFYLFLLVWLLLQKYSGVSLIGMFFILYFSIQKFKTIHKDVLISLDENARAISASAKIIEPNSSVTSFNYTGNWLTLHFSNYLGIEKPLIITDNYEASVGWFPLTWNYTKAPLYTFNSEVLVPDNQTVKRTQAPVKYVVVFGNIYGFQSDSVKFKMINDQYNKVYASEPSYVEVYKLK